MKFIFSCVLIFFSCASYAFPDDSGHDCKPGSSWYDGCNHHFCGDGGQMGSTLVFCGSSDGSQMVPRLEDFTCKSGSEWRQDKCNWCHCVDDVPVCTEKFCPPAWLTGPGRNSPDYLAFLQRKGATECSPTQAPREGTWHEDCNECSCLATGVAKCSQASCSRYPDGLDSKCTGNAEWKRDCNQCNCRHGVPICRQKDCFKEFLDATESTDAENPSGVVAVGSGAESEEECKVLNRSDKWRDGCNWCRCVNGKPACTKRGCPPVLLERLSGTDECEGNPQWKKDCNWCSCANKRGVCTRMACLPKQVLQTRVPIELRGGRQCKDGSHWTESCNSCYCTDGGAACTLRGCLTEVENTCSEGSFWRTNDCNWCSCSSTGAPICTEKLCAGKEQEADGNAVSSGVTMQSNNMKCTEGSRWRKDDCNWCSCAGGAAACTLMACVGITDGVSVVESTMECVEGSSWSDGCNYCGCSNGRSLCTQRACLESRSGTAAGSGNGKSVFPEPAIVTPPSRRARFLPQFGGWGGGGGGGWGGGGQQPSSGIGSDNRECVPGSRFKQDGCNWCTCTSTGVAACTLMACFTRRGKSVTVEKMCEEGSRWKKDCNWCDCVRGRAVCTEIACLNSMLEQTPPQSAPSDEPEEVDIPDNAECTEGSRWRKSCNWCSCSNGRGACTLRACLPGFKEEGPDCEEGSRWKDDCNWCQCTSTGISICTLAACLPSRPGRGRSFAPQNRPVAVPDADALCTPGSRWRKDCNWCFCTDTGGAACTLMGCLPGYKQEGPDCEVGSRWKKDCNWCQCTSTGISICTLAACLPTRPGGGHNPILPPRPPAVEPPADAQCIDGSRWRQDCNWCSCGNGHAACTLRACLPGYQDDGPSCEAGSRWKDDCNWCQCTSTGQAVCTLAACIPQRPGGGQQPAPPSPPPAESRCTEGSRWRNNCNWCSCSNGHAICTLIACLPGYQDNGPSCEAGSRWKNDCNWCQCRSTGHAVCTLAACIPQRHNTGIVPPHLREQSPISFGAGNGRSIGATSLQESFDTDKDCVPGSRFKHRCNWCHCSKSGHKLCTMMGCDPNADYSDEKVCEDGAVFKDEQNCNWCRCFNGHGACTQKLCLNRGRSVDAAAPSTASVAVPFSASVAAPSSALVAVPGATGENSQECNEGHSWVEGCNQCQCRNGFKFCTRRICFDQESAQDNPVSADDNKCLHPADSGPCFASFRMFRYNSENKRCEVFLFGGCGGNENRFATPEECHQTCGGDAPVLDSMCDRTKCPEYRENPYRELKGCFPVYEKASCCATGYNCVATRAVEKLDSQCMYKGIAYKIGEEVPITEPCSKCHCGSGGVMQCISVECPSLFAQHELGCRYLYRQGECCEYKKECRDPFSEVSQVPVPEVTCAAENKTYYDGDQMYFDSHGCQICICGADYSGPYGEGCKKIDCGYDFRYLDRIQKGCVPLYFREGCCPITFICPGAGEISTDQSQANPDGLTEDVCTFNNQAVAVGRELATTEKKITCSCKIPPYVTCVQNAN